ncbi:hypothetical protein PsYK624_034490 [Phanerochaete sordida]|uniref:Prolyl 4-hydroxylase alpha subunit Fe(2+) 2OG dioxygenase domain-containing protein n=1 Tax=Phanerochaete sordida TaxID=48140 RepID=A0A9P3G325_9APHY|nr:hypothetical protein PsYK624_034490 [Phanerochaete sordida]
MSEEQHQEAVLDVRSSFETALAETEKDFQAAFSFHRPYPEAPNPALTLSDLGVVGLPLSTRDADAIKSRSVQAPFGMGERTMVDTAVRDTWEIDAKQVSFSNPTWDAWLSGVVEEVCRTLGVNFAASRPRAELYKLLLYETGSHFLPHVDTEKTDGMFATIIIVLPSLFTGGAAHLTFGDLSTVYDCAPKSLLETSVMAWYTDVTHEIKPITCGYRLALSYNMLHTTTSLRPALQSQNSVAEKLQRVLLAWRGDTSGRAPQKLLFLLDHKYSEANLSAAALKGADAQRVAVLDALAKTHGFRLGLANAHCHLSGPANDCGGGGGGWDDSADEDDLDFVEVYEREMTIEHFVGLDGALIAEALEYDEGETIPADLTQSVEEDGHDEQEYEGYMGNGAGTLERWYRRTVLVLWPARNNYAVLYTPEAGFARALEDLHEDNTPAAERELVAFVLANRARGPGAAAAAVCMSALHAGDAKLWQRAVAMCAAEGAGVKVVEDEVWREAGERWGWDAVRPSLELMLAHDRGNQARLDFLRALREKAPWAPIAMDAGAVAALHAQLLPWAAAQVPVVLGSLRTLAPGESLALLRAAHENGGMACLKDVVLPQVVALASEDTLRHFATQLFASDLFAESPEKSAAVSSLLSAAIAKTVFFKPAPAQPAYYNSWRYPPQPQAPATDYTVVAKSCIQTCVVLGCAELVGAVLARVGDTATLNARRAQECARTLMLPVVAACAERMRVAPQSVPQDAFVMLKEKAVTLYFDGFAANAAGVTRADVAALVGATLADGDATVFVTTVVPRLEAMKWSEASLRALIDELHAQRARFVFPQSYTGRTFDAVFAGLVQRFIALSTPPTSASIVGTLDWLRTLGAPFWPQALARYVDPPGASAQYARTVLVLLGPALRHWGARHGLVRELGPALAALVRAWLRLVLGRAPPPNAALAGQLAALNRWTCTCVHCADARKFLTKGTERAKSMYRIGAPARKHVEGFLAAHARGLATCALVRSTPQGLTITRSDALQQLLVWRTEHANGKALLKSIAPDDAELRRVLGAAYPEIVATLNGSANPPPPAAAGPGTSSAHRPALPPAPTAQAVAPVPVPSAPAQSAAAAPSLASLPQNYQLPPGFLGQAGSAALLPQLQLPASVVNALVRRRDAEPFPAASSAPVGAAASEPAAGGEPPAKKRKYFPADPDDIIDLT